MLELQAAPAACTWTCSRVVGLVGLLVLWWAVTFLGLVPPLFLPPPGDVADAIASNFFASPYLENYHLGNKGLSGNLLYTIRNVMIALVIACALGVTMGLTSARIQKLRAVFDPVVLNIGTKPVLVTAPFFLMWFGTERAPQVALLVLYDTTIVYKFAQRAVGNLDLIYQAAARTLGASPLRPYERSRGSRPGSGLTPRRSAGHLRDMSVLSPLRLDRQTGLVCPGGETLDGKIEHTAVRGGVVYTDGKIKVPSGYGEFITPIRQSAACSVPRFEPAVA